MTRKRQATNENKEVAEKNVNLWWSDWGENQTESCQPLMIEVGERDAENPFDWLLHRIDEGGWSVLYFGLDHLRLLLDHPPISPLTKINMDPPLYFMFMRATPMGEGKWNGYMMFIASEKCNIHFYNSINSGHLIS